MAKELTKTQKFILNHRYICYTVIDIFSGVSTFILYRLIMQGNLNNISAKDIIQLLMFLWSCFFCAFYIYNWVEKNLRKYMEEE